MVKIAIATLFAASLAGFAVADNCVEGLTYCGKVLLRRGDYNTQIRGALESAGEDVSEDAINNSLFHCDGSGNGGIKYVDFCPEGCADAGDGNSDSC